MTSNSNNNGRGFEYICLLSLYEAIKEVRTAQILQDSSYQAAEKAWLELAPQQQALYTLSAKSTIDTIFSLEPNIIESTPDILTLYIQRDTRGEDADVRDIIIERKDIKWEIGLSIKHNHLAAKHSRIARHLDFGEKWYGVKCSQEYWNEIKPTFDFLEQEKNKGTYFRDLKSKEEDVYIPLLQAFSNEITRQIEAHPDIPSKLVEYLLSKYDFYKVISIDKQRRTIIEAFDMYGTLNKASNEKEPDIKISPIELPTTLLHIGFKPKSQTTILLCFDNGWQFSFRIHNAKDIIETSLKFDIQIVGMPTEVNIKFTCNW